MAALYQTFGSLQLLDILLFPCLDHDLSNLLVRLVSEECAFNMLVCIFVRVADLTLRKVAVQVLRVGVVVRDIPRNA